MGYDDAFVRNMARVVRLLREEPEARLVLTDRPDAMCRACPHLSDEGCGRDEDASERVRGRDAATLHLLGRQPGTRITTAAAYALVKEKLTRELMADQICTGCEWQDYGYCAEGLLNLRQESG